MMKLVFLVVVCVLGTVLCETHEQQKEYAQNLVQEMQYAAEKTEKFLLSSDESTQRKANQLLIQAISLNSDIHFILDCLQHVVLQYENEKQPIALQDIVLNLGNVTYELEDSFAYKISDVKLQLRSSVQSIVNEAKKLQQIIRSDRNHMYRSTVFRFLDDLLNAIQKIQFTSTVRSDPTKIVFKTGVQVMRRSLTFYLSQINSDDQQVHNDIARYSSKFSSVISATASLLQDLTYTYKTTKEDEVKEIVYSLGKISYANEEVLYNENSFPKIKEQLLVTIIDVAKQLNNVIDAGFSGITLQDDNLLYIVFPEIFSHSYKLMRNFAKSYSNYIH